MILLTGGSGLLGKELQKLIRCYAPPRQAFNITKKCELPSDIHLIVHCAAYTDVLKSEIEKDWAYKVNVLGTLQMTDFGLPIVHISTEYVFSGVKGNYAEGDCTNPVNYYGVTKDIAENVVWKAKKKLIVRTLFKPRPFKHAAAFVDQYTTGDYVDVIAPLIAKAIEEFDSDRLNGVIHIGTEKKSTYDLARKTRGVQKARIGDLILKLPRDTSLDCSRWESLKH